MVAGATRRARTFDTGVVIKKVNAESECSTQGMARFYLEQSF